MTADRLNRRPVSYDLFSKYREAIMGLAVLGILVFHFTEDCKTEGVRFYGWVRIYYTYVRSSGVDIFVMVSGLGLYYSMKKSPERSLKDYYRHRFVRILVPYCIVAVPALIWRDLIFEGQTLLYWFSDLTFLTFFREGRLWFWFIPLIGFCYLISPYIIRLFEDDTDDTSAQMRLLTVFNFTMVVALIFSVQIPKLHNRLNIAWMRIFPFVLGVYFGRAAYSKKRISFSSMCLFGCSLLLLPLAKYEESILWRCALAAANGFLYFLFILILEFAPVGITKLPIAILNRIGHYTLEIYLTHTMVRGVFVMTRHPCCWLRYEALMLVLSGTLTLLLKSISARLIPLLEHGKKAKAAVR